MAKVTVTGGCGFIGCHLVEALVVEGHDVVVADYLQQDYGLLGNLEKVAGMVEFRRTDLTRLDEAVRAVSDSSIVFHLAAMSHIPVCGANPLRTVEANYLATANILEAARSCGNVKIIYAGTDHIYALGDDHIGESCRMDPVEIYALTKMQSVQLCRLYHKQYGSDVRILVSGNVFGERQDMSKVVPRFVKAALDNKPIMVFGGEQSRDFYHVRNLVNAYLLVAKYGKAGETYNVGGNEEISVRELAERIVALTGSSSAVVTEGYRVDESARTRLHLDISKIKALGYREDVGFTEGLGRAVEWYRLKDGKGRKLD